MDAREQQLQYEIETDAEAATARLEELRKAAQEGTVELPRAQAYIARAYADVRDSIEAAQAQKTRGVGGRFKGWLRQLSPEIAAVIAIRECVSVLTCRVQGKRPITAQVLTKEIGRLYELEIKIKEASTVNPMYMQKVEERIKDHNTKSKRHLRAAYTAAYTEVMKGQLDSTLSPSELMSLGKFGLQACIDAGLVEASRIRVKGQLLVVYSLMPEVLAFLTEYNERDVQNVMNKAAGAMLCPPDPWTNLRDGGYLSNRRKHLQPLMSTAKMRSTERARIREEFTAEKMPQVFAAANYLQSIAYSVHQPTLDAIRRVWDQGGGVMGVPKKNPPEAPAFPFAETWSSAEATEAEADAFSQWKLRKARYYDDMREWRGKVREIGGFLRTAGKTSGNIWFPVFFDGRGRWYYRGSPNPQGSDLSKGVLHFGVKKPLGKRGLYWLKVSIANAFGFDKKHFDSRVAWTDENWPAIQRALETPEDFPEVWGDSPWCMYTAAYELNQALLSGNPEAYCTGIPVHMDATCSGLQHFSALMRDPVGAKYVNMIPPGDTKEDIYTKVSETALEAFSRDAEDSDILKASVASWWRGTGIPRGMAKTPVMTYVYGATLRGTTHHVQSFAEEDMQVQWPGIAKPYEIAQAAARKLFTGVAITVPAADNVMRWLRGIAGQMPNGTRMEWTTPLGFKVQHDYQEFDEKRIRLRSCGVDTIIVREYNEDTNPAQMRNAIAPNFVHALDATHLAFTALGMGKRGLDMVGIHDSFGTHACDVDALHDVLRKEFIRMYTEYNILEDFMWEVGGLGSIPNKGNLDLSQVFDSWAFFS